MSLSSGWPASCSRTARESPVSGENSAQQSSHRRRDSIAWSSATSSTPYSQATSPPPSCACRPAERSHRAAGTSLQRSKRLERWQTSHSVTGSLASQATVTAARSIILTFISQRSPPMYWKASTLGGCFWGSTYASGESTRGIWGLYGNYDYISPQVFRVSNTALSLGTTWQTWLSKTVALQGTALAGAGYGAAGSIEQTGERDYHYGVTPHGLLSLRFMFGDRVMIDLTGREYYVSNVFSSEHGWENIFRGDSSLTVRVYDRHGVALRYSHSHRDASYSNIEYKNQTVGMVSLMYVFLGETGFGTVEWR